MTSSQTSVLQPQLSICVFLSSDSLAQSVKQFLSSDRYILNHLSTKEEFCEFIEQQKQHIDCLILQVERALLPIINWLYEQAIMLPVVICQPETNNSSHSEALKVELSEILNNSDNFDKLPSYIYHPGEVHLPTVRINEIEHSIEQAIANFLKLNPHHQSSEQIAVAKPLKDPDAQTFLMQQQHRLAEKLKERLGYLGVYYKRNPQYFFRHLPATEKEKFLEDLRSDYRLIILSYFSDEDNLNQKIDNFVNMVFFADLPVAQIVEIHMELMEQFSKQLKMEGRNDDILLDYRLTLIDIISHLCEMYRRSIPRNS